MIKRTLKNIIIDNFKSGFINMIYGPRRVGKTVLSDQIIDRLSDKKWLKFNGDTSEARDLLSTTSITNLSALVSGYDAIFIDEAQRIPNIGLSLKILIDTYPELIILVTGSSSIDLSKGMSESLTGRTLKYYLYPISVEEISSAEGPVYLNANKDNLLLYGAYPYILDLNNIQDKRDYLDSIVEDYLLKDIKDLAYVESYENLIKLAKLISFQVGQEVSISELSSALQVDDKTVKRYISLLKKAFIIFEISSYSTNLKKEIVKSKKFYFWDLGIRNSLINQFQPLDIRNDVGKLWENFLAVERKKQIRYKRENINLYFWRNYDGAEIDWIEEKDGQISPYEFKYTKNNARTPKYFLDNYGKEVEVVNQENYLGFVIENN